MSRAHLSFTSSFTPELAWRAWFIMSYTSDGAVSAPGGGQRRRQGDAAPDKPTSSSPPPAQKATEQERRPQGDRARGTGVGVGGRVQIEAEKWGDLPTLPAMSCRGHLPLAERRGAWRWAEPVFSPAQSPRLLQNPEEPLHPRCYLNPPHSIFDGCGRGCHLLVHHGPKLLLTHIQALGLQLLGKRAQRSQGGRPRGGVRERLQQRRAGRWGHCPCPVSSSCRLCIGPPVQPKLKGSAGKSGTPAHAQGHGCSPHLAQLQDALQGASHQARLGLVQSLLLLQLPQELQSTGPALPARVHQACGERSVRGPHWGALEAALRWV